MKSFTVIFLFCALTASLSAESNVKMLAESVAVERMSLSAETRPVQEIVYSLSSQTMEDLKSIFHESGYMLSVPVQEILEETGSISYPDLFKLLNSDRDFVLDQYFPMSIVRGSYRKIRTETCVVGEMVFSTPHDGSFVSDPFIYELFFLDDNRIWRLSLQTYLAENYEALDSVFSSLPELTYKKDGYWYWRNNGEALEELCRLMENHDETLPKGLLALQEAWEQILGNLEINGERISLY